MELWGATRKQAATAILTAFVIIIAGFGAAELWESKDDPPSLSDTLSWIDATYNAHGEQGGAFGHGMNDVLTGPGRRTVSETISTSGCTMSIHAIGDEMGISVNRTDKFNLGDLDPNSFDVATTEASTGLDCKLDPQNAAQLCDTEEFTVETRNAAPLINVIDHHQSNKTLKIPSKTFFVVFYLNDIRYANRFERALRHAVKLCGGAASSF